MNILKLALLSTILILAGCTSTFNSMHEAAHQEEIQIPAHQMGDHHMKMHGQMHGIHHGAECGSNVIYTCNCGEQCTCNTVSTQPGECKCGKPLAAGHIVKIEGDEALVCICGADCQCKLNTDDPTKCACGKPIKRVSLKGTGLYFCNCGGSCFCNTIAQEACECKCGMKLKKSE